MLGEELYTEKKPTIYLNVTNGRLERYSKGGQKQGYSFLTGTLIDIRQVDREFKGQTLPYWYVNFGADGERYSIGFPFNNNVFKSIVLSLANKEQVDLGREVKLSIYTVQGKTKAKITQGEKPVRWIEEPLPPIEEIQAGGKVVRDDTKRMEFITSLVELINLRTKTAV